MAKNMDIALLFDFYGDMLTDKQRGVVELYYNDDLSLSEIAENEGITRQGVRDSIKRAEAQLLEMEERLGLARRFHDMREGLEAIRTAAGDIRRLNDRYGYSREIHDRAGRILELASRLAEEG
ncbi:MAG: YlxM family DNA-binding protein [Clostridiales bacterium]|nr:YlxM family DNA-binding protein [Clostridiales bacterium]